jgi:hypothetical protein
MISCSIRFFFAKIALNMIRNAPAVLPCLPMIFPTSVSASRSSSIDVCISPISVTVTDTRLGRSSKVWAIVSMISFDDQHKIAKANQKRAMAGTTKKKTPLHSTHTG